MAGETGQKAKQVLAGEWRAGETVAQSAVEQGAVELVTIGEADHQTRRGESMKQEAAWPECCRAACGVQAGDTNWRTRKKEAAQHVGCLAASGVQAGGAGRKTVKQGSEVSW